MPSVISEHAKLPTEGSFDLSNNGIITISGDDAKKFLQGQLTCNLEEITPTQSRLGAYCDIKGRVIALFRIFQIDNLYHLILNKTLIEKTVKILGKYAVFSRVKIDTNNPFTAHFGIIGDRSNNFPNNIDEVVTQNNEIIIRIPSSIPRWEILSHNGKLTTSINSVENWEAHNILAGIPDLTTNTSGEFTAHRLGLVRLNAINFKKGCYLGQEIVARTQYLGKQKGGLYFALTNSPYHLSPNSEIIDSHQQLIGNIINAVILPNNTTLLLAVLKQDPTEENVVTIENQSIELSANFTQDFP